MLKGTSVSQPMSHLPLYRLADLTVKAVPFMYA